MKLSKDLYQDMQKQTAPPTRSYYTIPMAFLIGGFICTLGELLLHLYQFFSFSETEAAALTSVTLVFLSALFTGLGWYEKIAKHAGAGTLVPITGFANAVSCCAIESRAEGWVLGIGAKMFTIAGPVIVYGTAASMVYGLIYYLFTL
jgi:stage V sporulation protein AC